jgi:hypothetical protein
MNLLMDDVRVYARAGETALRMAKQLNSDALASGGISKRGAWRASNSAIPEGRTSRRAGRPR